MISPNIRTIQMGDDSLMKLISACLCGINCKYNGGNNLHPYFLELMQQKKIIPVCPEELGGLPTPRTPSEISAGNGIDVLEGRRRVIDKEGIDITEYFLKGAYKTLTIAQDMGVKCAVLKSRSPSCGVGQIYDGTFKSVLRPGDGVAAALLRKHGIKVINDDDFLRNIKEF